MKEKTGRRGGGRKGGRERGRELYEGKSRKRRKKLEEDRKKVREGGNCLKGKNKRKEGKERGIVLKKRYEEEE